MTDNGPAKQFTQVDLPKLGKFIAQYFDENELQELTFELGVDYEDLPAVGKANKAIELVKSFERRQRIDLLLEACMAARPHIDWQAVTLITTNERPPFKGLQAFDEEDADLFFGREELTHSLIARLNTALKQGQGAFLAVVGASGSGKSSVVRAGVLPILRRGVSLDDGTQLADSSHWPIHIITPSAHPLESLATELTDASESVKATTTLITDMGHTATSLHLFVKKKLSHAPHQRLLLFIDQFEEVFTLCHDEAERQAFIDNVITATTLPNSQTVVIITLRADFYAQCSQFDNLRAQLERQQKFLGPMTAAELRQAIEKPAVNAGYTFESGLVTTLLREVGSEPGALPLLSHALLETWKRRRGRQLTFEGYNEAGGIHGAIAKTADGVYDYQLTEQQQAIAKRIFLSLTEISEDGQDTRRRASLTELIPRPQDKNEVNAVLRILTQARLIIVGEETAEVAHEALIREWPQLQRWLDDNREGLRLQRQLQSDAEAWLALEKDEGALYRGARLAQALEWTADHPTDLTPLSQRFLRISQAVIEREEARREEQRQRELKTAQKLAQSERERAETQMRSARKLRRWTHYLVGLVIIAFLSAGAAAYATNQAEQREADLVQANKQLDTANQQAQQNIRIAQATLLSTRSQALSHESPQLSLLLAVEATKLLRPEDPRVPEVEEALWQTLANFSGRQLTQHEGVVKTVNISPNGRWLVTGSEDYTSHLYDLTDLDAPPITLYGSLGPVFAAAITPDSQYLITGSWDGQIYIWDLTAPGSHVMLESGSSTIVSITVSSDGQWLVTGSDDGTTNVWDLNDLFEPVRTLPGHAGSVTAVDISPDNQWLVTGSDDGLALLWDFTNLDTPPRTISRLNIAKTISSDVADAGHLEVLPARLPPEYLSTFIDGAIFDATFSKDNHWLITVGGTPPWINQQAGDYIISLWDVAHLNQPPILLQGHEGYITDVAVSADNHWLVTTSWDRTIRVWDLTNLDAPPAVLQGHEDFVTSVDISPDSRYMVTGSGDHSTRLWDLNFLNNAPQVLYGHRAQINTAAVSADNRWLATGSNDTTIRLWDLQDPNHASHLLTAHQTPVTAVALSPDNRWLASSSQEGDVHLWQMADITGEQVEFDRPTAVLGGHEDGVYSLAISADSRWLVSGSYDKTARLWDLLNPTAQPIVLRGHDAAIFDVAISPDNRWLVTASQDGTSRVWDLANPGVEQRILTGHAAAVTAAAFSSDSQWLVTGSQDNTARLWSLADLTADPTVLRGHTDGVLHVAISSDNRWIVTAGLDNTLRLWEPQTSLTSSKVLRGHDTWITSLSLSANSRWLVSGSFDGSLHLWDLHNLGIGSVVLNGHIGSIEATAISDDGRLLVTVGSDTSAHLWPLELENLLTLACQTAGRNMTRQEWEEFFPGIPYRATCANILPHPAPSDELN